MICVFYVCGGGLAVGVMVVSVVGWKFCSLSTGWEVGTLRALDEPFVEAQIFHQCSALDWLIAMVWTPLSRVQRCLNQKKKSENV